MTPPIESMTPPPVGLLLSGGLDSCILLGVLLEQQRTVQPLFIRGGLLWETAELTAVRRFLDRLSRPRLLPLVELAQPVRDLYGDHWSTTGRNTPSADTADEAVFLPGRNALLLVKALIWCQLHGISEIALAPLASNPFGDASDEFFSDLEHAMRRALSADLAISRPFARLHKREVMALGAHLPLELSFSCIAPQGDRHCGHCNKCGERRQAFRDAQIVDRTEYAG